MQKLTINRNKGIIISIAVLCIFALAFAMLFSSENKAWATESKQQLFEEKIYCQTMIDEEFDDSCVLAVFG